MKKILSIIMSATLLLCCFAIFAGAQTLPADAQIVISETAAETDKTAANTLHDYLYKITGVEIPVVTDSAAKTSFEFSVGNTTRFTHTFGDELDGSYVIKSFDGGVAISGVGNRGTIYGVYGFLEKYCACKWYTSELIVTPENKALDIPSDIDYTYNCFFEHTDTDWKSPRDIEYSLANGLSGGNYRQIPAEQGGTVNYISSFCHTLTTQFCSAEKYFESHPEYFSLHEGKRTPDQLCLTNEDVYELVLSEVMDLLKEKHDPNESLQIISLTQYDNKVYCTCEACAAIDSENGSPSGTNITFVNRIAEEVAAAGYDNVAIDTFAYLHTRKPPEKVVPADNVIVRVCTIECCFTHTLDDKSCEDNVALMQDLAGWGKICDRLNVWDYATNYSYTFGIFPDFGVIQRNMQIFHENSVKGVYEEGNYYMESCDTEFGELRAYLLSKLMQDPYCDFDSEMNGFLEAYYGAGYRSIRSFIDGMSETAAKNHVHIYDKMEEIEISAAQVKAFDEMWSAAKEATTDETQLANIERSELSWRFWKGCTNSGEFKNPFTVLSERKKLYDDILATGATKRSEGSKDFTELTLINVLASPTIWSTTETVFTPLNYKTAAVLYAVCLLGALILFIEAIKKKQKMYLIHLPLLAGALALVLWNRTAYISWESVGEFLFTVILFALIFAFLMIAHAKQKGALNTKRIILNGLAGAVIFLAVYFPALFIVNIGIYNGAGNNLSLSISLLLVAIVTIAIVFHTLSLMKKNKKAQAKEKVEITE